MWPPAMSAISGTRPSMSMKHSAALLALTVIGGALALTAAAPAPVLAQDPYLKDADLSKLGKTIAEFFEAKTEKRGILESEEAFDEQLIKLQKKLKKAPVESLMESPADLGRALWLSAEYPKAKKIRKGKIEDVKYQGGFFKDEPLVYTRWVPAKYDAKRTAYTLIISIPDEDEKPKDHLGERWNNSDLRASSIIAVPHMPENKADWTETAGLAAVLVTMQQVTQTVATDFDRIYLSGRGVGVAAALAIAEKFPHRFAGVIGRSGDAGVTPASNFSNLPTFFAGGGSQATAFEEAAKGLGWENVTLATEAQEPEVWTWMQGHPRTAYPEELTLYPGKSFPTRAYWLEVRRGSTSEGAKIHAKLERDTNSIIIDAEGVPSATLFLSDQMLDLSKPVRVVTNGTEIEELVPRSRKQFLKMAYDAVVDPSQIFVAQLKITITPKAKDDK